MLVNQAEAKRKRKDGKLDHVIINEKREKSLKAFLVKDVPHEFGTKEQFNFIMSQPVGSDWSGVKNFQNNIKPAVLTTKGKSIMPISEKGGPKQKYL